MASDSRRRFTQSLMGRLALTGILPAVLVILVQIGINGTRRYFSMLETEQARMVDEAEEIALSIEADNRSAVDIARMIAIAQEHGLFGNRQKTLEFLKHVLQDYRQDITGTYVIYEPNADGHDATERIPGATLTAEMVDSLGKPEAVGRFAPYYFLDWKNNDSIALKSCRQMEVGSYYQRPRNNWMQHGKAEPVITEPYEYEGQMIIEQPWPIVRDGKFVGIGATDRSLTQLQDAIQRRAQSAGIDIFLVSPGGRIIVASDNSGADYSKSGDLDTLQSREVASTAYGDLFSEFQKDPRPSFSVAANNPGSEGSSYFAVARVPTGNWMVVMSIPSSVLMMPIYTEVATALCVAFGGMIVVVIILWLPARAVVRRVEAAAAAAQQVAAGDLTRPASGCDCPDETGQLLNALDSMTADLNTLVGQVKTASIQLNTIATELGATSRQQEEVAASFGASSAQIAAAVKQITTTGQELAREMVHVSESASATAVLAQDGRAQLEGMEGAMRSLDQATGGVADRLAAINEKAVNITGVVTTITKVAEQTNLLSVNAAIEAEKAGEYGRGFLVVAREIRRLADQTAQATLDIERMVKEMQGAVSSGVMEMDRFSDQVRRSVTDTRTIRSSMQEIIERVNEGTSSFGTVKEGMQSQAAGASQISEAMTGLSSNAKATSESVREFGRAAEELQKSIGSLKAAIAAFHLRS